MFPIFCIPALCLMLISIGFADERDLPTIFPGNEALDVSTKLSLLQDEPATTKLNELLDPARHHALDEASNLAGSDRARMVAILYEFLRDRRLQRETGWRYPSLMQALLKLGDERAMQLLAEKLRSDPEFRQSDIPGAEIEEALERAAQPAVIPYLAPILFINESPEWDVTVPDDIPTGDKISFQAVHMIQKVLEKAEAIPWRVKVWSRRLRTSDVARGEYRELLRDWWKANQQAFQRKDYAAIRPGREWFVAKDLAPPVPTQEPTRAVTPSTPVAQKQTPAVVATYESQPLWMLVTGAALAVAALAGLLVFWKRRE